jgi:hypothetical protein
MTHFCDGAQSAPRDEVKATVVKIEKENLSSSWEIDGTT